MYGWMDVCHGWRLIFFGKNLNEQALFLFTYVCLGSMSDILEQLGLFRLNFEMPYFLVILVANDR